MAYRKESVKSWATQPTDAAASRFWRRCSRSYRPSHQWRVGPNHRRPPRTPIPMAGRISRRSRNTGRRSECARPSRWSFIPKPTFRPSGRSCHSGQQRGAHRRERAAAGYGAAEVIAVDSRLRQPVTQEDGSLAHSAGIDGGRNPRRDHIGETNMEYDLKLKNGLIIDGTGQPGFRGDVAVKDGRIVALGEAAGSAVRTVDADGLVVSPGFVDIHTHYDAQILWDRMMTVSPWHGVTSVVMGNCGFSVAPTRPEHRGQIMRTLEKVEGMNLDALEAGMGYDWPFVTFRRVPRRRRTSRRRNQCRRAGRPYRGADVRNGRRRLRTGRYRRRNCADAGGGARIDARRRRGIFHLARPARTSVTWASPCPAARPPWMNYWP